MTSRVSFHKLLIETLKRHLAVILITILVFFIHLISFFLSVQNTINALYIEDVKDALRAVHPSILNAERITEGLIELSLPSFTNGLIALLLGVYLAFDFFKYMHSKKQTDFYDSLPVRKEKWFLTIFICGIGVFSALCTLTITIEILILFGTGYGSAIMLQNMLWTLVCMLGCFLASWVTTALAMIMTGNSIIAFLGVGVFASYVPLILNYLFSYYEATFFDTYVGIDNNTLAFYFSPVSLTYKLTYSWNDWNIQEHWTYMIGIFAFALVLGLISYLLFLKRPSETAGRAMAFEKFNSIIRIMLVIPLALYAGLFLFEISEFASTAWLIFGVIFAAFILHGIIESVFQFDIRALITKKRQLFLCIVFSLLFVGAYALDIFKYDEYIPDAEDIESVELISSGALDSFDSDYWEIEKDWLQGENIDIALKVAKELIDNPFEEDSIADSITFYYHLKNGQIRKRRYTHSMVEYPESLDDLYATKDYKDDYCVLYSIDRNSIKKIVCDNGITEEALSLSQEQISKLIDIYLEEFTSITYHDLTKNPVVYRIEFECQLDGDSHTRNASYYVYSSFEKTIAFLKEQGLITFAENPECKVVNLELYSGKYVDVEHQYITDPAQLETLKKDMILSEFVFYWNTEEYIYCDIRYEYNGKEYYKDVFLHESVLDGVLY